MNIFQRKNSKRSKDKDGSRGKNDLFDRAKGGLGALAEGLQTAKNDAEAATEKLQGDVKSGIETILQSGSGILEKAKAELGSQSEATRSKELGKLHYSFRVTSKEEGGSHNARFRNLFLNPVGVLVDVPFQRN